MRQVEDSWLHSTNPNLKWDFRLPLVKSINVSGHKYGLVYPGVGWVIWRDQAELPEELVFHVNYLGGDQPTFNLNFSKGANQILGQYYNFLRLGRAGYRQIMEALQATAAYLTDEIERLGRFTLLSKRGHLPVVTLALKENGSFTVFDLSAKLRERGGGLSRPYTMAPDAQDIAVLRIVVREGLSRDMADLLINDLQNAVVHFEKHAAPPRTRKKRKPQGVC